MCAETDGPKNDKLLVWVAVGTASEQEVDSVCTVLCVAAAMACSSSFEILAPYGSAGREGGREVNAE